MQHQVLIWGLKPVLHTMTWLQIYTAHVAVVVHGQTMVNVMFLSQTPSFSPNEGPWSYRSVARALLPAVAGCLPGAGSLPSAPTKGASSAYKVDLRGIEYAFCVQVWIRLLL